MKGFIGPIGEDIPAVLFIVMGLSVFFTAIFWVYTGWSERQQGFEYSQSIIELSRMFTKDQVIDCNHFYQSDTYKEGMERARALEVDVSLSITDISHSVSCDGTLLVYPVVCDDFSIKKMAICIAR